MAAVIVAKDLYKCYAGFAPVLRGVNIEVQAGELVAIMGPSGCGKSTMLHVLGMLHKPDAGTLSIMDTDVLSLNREQTASFRRGNMGFVMQASNLFEHSTVFENVEFPLIYENVPPQERWERVIRALELVRLSARVHYRSNRLSGGEQQRVAIARAMVNNPRILLADEPTGALDARTSRLIMENFRSLCHEGGVSMVMVTHDPKMAEYCDSIYTLEDGILKCHKHELPQLEEGGRSLLAPPEAVLRGALVTDRFPQASALNIMEQAHRLHGAGRLSRIFAIRGSASLGNPEGYSLPLAVRHMGIWHSLGVWSALARQWAKGPVSMRALWQRLPVRGGWGKGFWQHLWAFACGALLRLWAEEEKADYFLAAGAHGPATAAWVASRLMDVPLIMAVQSHDLARPGRDWAVKAEDASMVLCDTEATRATLRSILPQVPQDKFFVLRDPLTLEPAEDEVEMPVPPGVPRVQPLQILAAGTLAAYKGYDVVLRACKGLQLGGVDFELKIAGNGPERRALRRLARRLGLRKQVHFIGHVPHENMADLYHKADIFVAAGRNEAQGPVDGLPSALTEAMAFGRAVVVSDLAGHLEAVEDGKSGLVIPENDPVALAASLKKLAEDPSLREALGQAAREKVHALLDDNTGIEAFMARLDKAVAQSRSAGTAKSGGHA